MNETLPETMLACAVIERAVLDLRNGSKERKMQALLDIRNGHLDYWVEIVDSEYDMAVEINRRLRDLAS